ncbi:unannotated protein [freshwater metagenome]|uniref:Unannotated protein n=1 Tax=freshwater metagenome TaxID=449393 RepID=A0A6J6ERL6_9ZZZZ
MPMSMRQFIPRRTVRHSTSPFLTLLVFAFLGLTIVMQILYPLVDGAVLDFITITSVYTAAISMFLHGFAVYGPRYAFTLFVIAVLFGFLIEQLGVTTGWPFGDYVYSDTLGPKVLEVPLVVPFAWLMIAHPCLVAARRIANLGSFYMEQLSCARGICF